MIAKKQFLDRLQERNARCQSSESLQPLLLKIIDYMELYDKEPHLIPVVQSINKDENTDNQKITLPEQDALNELDAKYNQLILYKKNVGFEQIPQLTDYESFGNHNPKKRIVTTWHPLEDKYCWLNRESDCCINKIIEQSPNAVIPAELLAIQSSNKYDNWLAIKSTIENDRLDKSYYFFNVLVWIYNIRKHGHQILHDMFNKGDILTVTSAGRFHQAIQKALSDPFNKDYTIKGLNIELLKYYVQKATDYTVEKLNIKTALLNIGEQSNTSATIEQIDQCIPFVPIKEAFKNISYEYDETQKIGTLLANNQPRPIKSHPASKFLYIIFTTKEGSPLEKIRDKLRPDRRGKEMSKGDSDCLYNLKSYWNKEVRCFVSRYSFDLSLSCDVFITEKGSMKISSQWRPYIKE